MGLRILIGVLVCGLVHCLPSIAAPDVISAGKEGLWTDDGVSLVIARVTEIREPANEREVYNATIEPIASISGSFDASAQRNLKISFASGDHPILAIHRAPRKESIIMVVLRKGTVVQETCTFMPDRSPLVVLDNGLADPWIAAVAKHIQRVRADPKSEDYRGPTTQPSDPGKADVKKGPK